MLLSAVIGMTSCKEDDNTVEEFPNWKENNTTYFENLYNTTVKNIAGGDTSWKIIRAYNLPSGNDDTNVNTSTSYTAKPEDNIVVKVLKEGTGTSTPLFTDSVRVHYLGHLLPSTSYSDGYIFDRSYYSNYDLSTMVPKGFYIYKLVSGFATAVQNMHIGDRWLVYVPYDLGYGTINGTINNITIPAYSTLVFDITLVAYYRSWKNSSAKAIGGTWIDE